LQHLFEESTNIVASYFAARGCEARKEQSPPPN
jgi:hypothetical protein